MRSTSFPVTIVDNFFDDPDAIVEESLQHQFYNADIGNWPGKRTKQLHVIDNRFFNYLGEKLFHLHFSKSPEEWTLQAHFQKIQPFSEDQYNRKNRGWVHQDIDTWFGGIIYLTKNPEPDTGTSIYKTKKGWSLQYKEEIGMKEKLYLNEPIDEELYDEVYDRVHDQYVETVKVENVYNRLVMFDGLCHHGVQTFGTKERLTLNFFGVDFKSGPGSMPPVLRSR
tara:strand:- start:40 stop:711 length:672 start_codon:yes stop_codon:yes gene_type:complete